MSNRKRATLNVYDLPEERPSHALGRVTVLRGANQCDVELTNKETHLILIPTKFHKVVWIKRGDFVIVDIYPATKTEHKVRGEIAHVLNPANIKEMKKMKKWPAEFSENDSAASQKSRFDLPPSSDEEEEENEDDSDDDLPANPNRQVAESDDEEGEEEGEEKPKLRRRYRGYIPSDEEEDEEDDEYDSYDSEDYSDSESD